MKKSLWLGAFAATMLFAYSCQNDDLSENLTNKKSVVSFTLEQPGISSRAFSDGLTATTLEYAVYKSGQTDAVPVFDGQIANAFTDKKATVSFVFPDPKEEEVGTDGAPQKYDFVFWAAAPVPADEAPYTFNRSTHTVTVNYENVVSNNDICDAFFASEVGLEVPKDGVTKTITLRRPFAQLNIGAIGGMDETLVGFNPTQSAVKINVQYNNLDLLTGAVEEIKVGEGESAVNVPTEYAMASFIGEDETFPVDGVNNYLSMSYLLVPADKETVDVTLTFADAEGEGQERTFPNIPVQRNYRTNIYGQMSEILSNTATFHVEMDEQYQNPTNNIYGVSVNGKRYRTIEEALNDVAVGDHTVVNLAENTYTIPANAVGRTLTFVGTGNVANTIIECKTEGTDKLNGSKVTFENLTIETDGATYKGFIHVSAATYKNCIIKNTLTTYTDGEPLQFDNCTFEVSGDAYNVWTWGASATFTKCTFNGDGKSVLVYGIKDHTVTFSNCTFNDNGGIGGKAAIEIGDDYLAAYTININQCTINGFDKTTQKDPNRGGDDLGTNVWGNKNLMTREKLNVFIDGVEVY